MITQTCPCCGSPIFDRDVQWFPQGRCLVVGNQAVTFSRQLAAIFDLLWTARLNGGGRVKEEFINALYFDDPNGGPDHAERTVYTQIMELRKQLEPVGLSIPTQTGKGPMYRLTGR